MNCIQDYKGLIYMLLANNDAILTEDNSIDIFTDGKEKFRSLFKDIEEAKETIHLQYYIFKKDGLGNKLIRAINRQSKARCESPNPL